MDVAGRVGGGEAWMVGQGRAMCSELRAIAVTVVGGHLNGPETLGKVWGGRCAWVGWVAGFMAGGAETERWRS